MTEPDIDAILRGGKSRRWWMVLSAAAAAVVIITAVVAFLLTRSDETAVVTEPERTEAVVGRLSTEVELSGSALAERSATLSFEVAGVVVSVSAAKGEQVRAGDTLGTLDDADAQRWVETAEVQLRLAQLRLDDLMTGPEPSAVASASQAITSAKSQVLSAELTLEGLSEPPSAADIASAEQAVASALGQISSAEQELALLSEPPNAADIASAEQAVASALGQISSAEQELALLSEPPSVADIASAEQAVSNALSLLSSEKEALATLMEGPSTAELAELRSAVTQAQVQLTEATTNEEALLEVLTEAYDGFCERYAGLSASDDVIGSTCVAELPLSDAQVKALRDSFEDRSITYETYGTTLIDANVAFVVGSADRESAVSGLASAEESLTNLLESITGDDIFQAEQSVEAAKASHAAAVARLDDLQTQASEDDLFQAQQAIEAAQASHAAAKARLEELMSAAEEEDVYQAEQALEAAKSSHAAAVARLEDLRAEVDERDVAQARAALESAQAGLASAQAQYDELLAGPSDNDIEQQRQDVRLAELSVEEARAALAVLTVIAPFDGVVEVVNVLPRDRIAAGSAAFTLNTSNRMLIALTVTEEELLDLEVGQTGLASFDAIEGGEYPVRVESISLVPNAEQGVVTYDVEARILTGPEGAEAADDARVGSTGPGGGFGQGGGFGPGGGFGGGAAAGLLADLELPEGVTIQQVMQAVARGDPLPEGVELPEGLEEAVQAFRGFAGAGQGTGQRQGANERPGANADRPLPAPGMSASVTILTEIREESVLVPVPAVRLLDGNWFVSVWSPSEIEGEDWFERVFVEVGESDGSNVEILGGIEAGTVLLIGADDAGIAFSATLQQPQANPGFGFGPPGGFGSGGRP